MKPYVLGAIFARGGSKRVPRKNLRMLAGEPLLAHAIAVAKSSNLIDRVIVSTDDTEIAETARRFGAEVPFMRPQYLSDDDSSEWLAWQHAIETLGMDRNYPSIDVFVCIPTTSPLKTVDDVDNCIKVFLEGDSDIVISVTDASHNPFYNMVIIDDENFARQVIDTEKTLYRRDAYPIVHQMTTIAYVASPEFVLNSVNPFEGRVRAVQIPEERALDIDTELDFKFAEFLLSNGAQPKTP